MAILLLAMDVKDSAQHVQPKFRCDMVKDAPVSERQQLLMAPTLNLQLVNARKAMEALKVTLQVVRW